MNDGVNIKVVDRNAMILVLHVDDLFLVGAEKLITWCQRELASKFEILALCTTSWDWKFGRDRMRS